MAEQSRGQDGVAEHVERVANVTKTPELKEVAAKVRDFDAKWGTGTKKK